MGTESLGFLLQGVSQQQPKIRSQGQVSEQVNWLSDVNRGLTTRPATIREGALPIITPATSKSVTVDIAGDLYRVVLEDGLLPKVFGYDGTQKTVVGAGSQPYVSTNAAVYTYDQMVYIANRDLIVDTVATSYMDTVVGNFAYVYCLGAGYSRTYDVYLTVGATKYHGTYTTPDGTNPGDANLTSAEYVIGQLIASLAAAGATSGAGVHINQNETHIRIWATGGNITGLSTHDGDANTLLRGDFSKAETVADLPKWSAHGDLVHITGDTSKTDDFWMRFEVDGTPAVGTGFGTNGTWKEYFNVYTPITLNPATMPHTLVRNTDGTFTFSAQTWQHRRVGDEDSNPTPSFVGYAIRDIREFQGRLTFATSGATVVMSRTDYPTDFWRKSAVSNVASDVIDIRATMEGTKPFDWLVPFDRDMFVLAANAQYVISGSGGMSPSNASIVLATNYNMSSQARPQPTGRTLLFPYQGQRYSGVNEYFTGNDYATTSVDNLSKTIAKYIDGEIREIVSASNEGLALFVTDASQDSGTVWVYKYIWEFDKKTQSAWSKWKFPGKVRHIHAANGVLFFWLVIGNDAVFMGEELVNWNGEDDEDAAGYTYVDAEEIVVSMRLDLPEMYDFDYPLAVDGAVTNAGTIEGDFIVINSAYVNPAFILNSTDADAPSGGVIEPDAIEIGDVGDPPYINYWFSTVDRPWLLTGTISYGERVKRYLDPTPPVARNYQGQPRSDVEMVVSAYYIDYADSGRFAAQMRSPYRGNEVMADTAWFPMDDDPVHPWQESVRSGTLQAPWGEYSKFASLRVYSDDIRPTTIQEIRYQPEYLKAGG